MMKLQWLDAAKAFYKSVVIFIFVVYLVVIKLYFNLGFYMLLFNINLAILFFN